MDVTAELICETLVQQIRRSRLNFLISETSYGVNISLKKKIIKEASSGDIASVWRNFELFSGDKNDELVEENKLLKKSIEKLESENETNKEIINILESKVEKAESDAYTNLKEVRVASEDRKKVVEDITVLKDVIKNFQKDITKNKNDLAHASKVIKAKDKEIHNLDIKILNHQDTIKNVKEKAKDLREEKLKLEREANKHKKKFDKKEVVKNIKSHGNNETEAKVKPPSNLTTLSSSTLSSPPGLDDNANQTDENLSHLPSVPIQNQFQVLNKSCLDENSTNLVTTNHMDTTCSLMATTSQHSLSSSLNTTPTSSLDRDFTCSLKTTTSQHPFSSSLDTNSASLVAASSLDRDTTCGIKATTSQHPFSSSLDTTPTSLAATSSLDPTFSVDKALANNDEEREMLKTLMKQLDDMIRKCEI